MKSIPRWVVAVAAVCSVLGCADNVTGPSDEGESLSKGIPVYSGSIGLVVDVREIFRKGYLPATADVKFTGQSAFDTVLTINRLTNVAILVIQNDSLTSTQKKAFANGVATTIVVRDSNQQELGRLQDNVELDNSNRPVSLTTLLPSVVPPLVLRGPGAAYFLQREGVAELVTRFFGFSTGGDFRAYDEARYQQPADPAWQQFTFNVRADSTYRVGHLAVPDSAWCVYESLQAGVGLVRQLRLDVLSPTATCAGGDARIVIEPDSDGWMRLKLASTGEYVVYAGLLALGHRALVTDPVIANTRAQATRFRLISDDIDWTASDRGTTFEQPVLPPARLDFAYIATITNCSPATVTETVGRTISQTRTTSVSTSESAQLFAGLQSTVGVKVGASAEIPVPPDPTPVNVSAEVSAQLQLTVSTTLTAGKIVETSTASAEQVSRERALALPPNTAVTVADYIKTIDDVVQPFTQQVRLRGAYRSNGTPLSGREIVTQMRFNLVQGVITRITADYVEFTVRGEVTTDHFMMAESTVREKPNACR